LYDNLFKKLSGYRAKVFYQKDVAILEQYGDEEAESFYKVKQEPGQNKGNYFK
jgi:hypothetical protein